MWDHLAAHIVDDERNRNNRFEVAAALNARISAGHGPFWGSPVRRVGESLSSKKAPGFAHPCAVGDLAEFRIAERRFLDNGMRVAATWQLLGAGSVGSQSLTGIPVLHHLRRHPSLAARSAIWPFETGFVPDPTHGGTDAIVHAEIWPGAIPLDPTLHAVRDAAQVIGLCRHLAALDRDGELGTLFAPELTDTERDVALAEEGWILAAPATWSGVGTRNPAQTG
jgi:precorrin-8X/cobalt-precorrin-8 methylmutase